MFVMAGTIGKENLKPDEPVVIKYDTQFGKIGVYTIGGELLGFLYEEQPDGCVNERIMYSRIKDYRIIARASVIMNGAILLSFDTPMFREKSEYMRTEKAGYGILLPQ